MKKRVLSLCMALILAIGLLPAAALAANAPFTATVDQTPVTDINEYTLKWTSLNGIQTIPCYTAAVPAGSDEAVLTFPAEKKLSYYSAAGTFIADADTGSAKSHTVSITDNNNDGEPDLVAVLNDTFTAVDYCICFVFPAATAEESTCIRINEGAITNGKVPAGGSYSLALSNVFSDSEGHGLTYSFTVDGEYSTTHTKIANGIFYFTAPEMGTKTVTLTATCSSGKAISHELIMDVTEPATGIFEQYNYNETPASSVTVYVTLSSDGMPLLGTDGTELAHLKMTVPYFDLANYKLTEYYRYQTTDGVNGGTYKNSVVVQRPTGLHLYIYLLERYYMGLPEKLCGKGLSSGVLSYSADTDVFYMNGDYAYSSNGNKALLYSGAATSFFMNSFWGHDCNLMYFRNHCYPYMTPGWGSTADYITLSDGDTIDIAMFTDWGFYHDGFFTSFDKDLYTVQPGKTLTVSTRKWGTTFEQGKFTGINGLNLALYNSDWQLVETLHYDSVSSNAITFEAPEKFGTYYLMALDPNATLGDPQVPGVDQTAKIAPGTARVVVSPDTDGDGILKKLDIQNVWKWLNGSKYNNGTANVDTMPNADMNNDGKLDMKDVSAMLQALQ